MSKALTWYKIPFKSGIWYGADWGDADVDDLLIEIQQWCVDAECGKRMAYDMFQFKTEGEALTFLLKWS